MKKKLVYVYICISILTGCVPPPEPPPGTLTQDQMTDILIEVHIAEASAQQAGFLELDSTQVYYKYLEKKIFQKYKTDSTQYHNSYRFYSEHPKLLQEIYTAVADTLTARQNRESQVHDSTTNKPLSEKVTQENLRLLRKK